MSKRDKSHHADNKKYRALFENSITALFITRPDGSILEANSAACRMFGYTEEEFRKLGRQGVIDPDTPELTKKLREREENGSAYGELIGIRKNGEKFWCEFSSSVFEDPEGGKMASVMLIDISDRKVMEERLKGVMNNVPGVVFRYIREPDGSDYLEYVSEGSEDVWGVSPEDILIDLSRVWVNFHEDDIDDVVQSVKESAETNSRWYSEYRYHHPDGFIRWCRGIGEPVSNENGRVVWDSIVLDITDEKQAEMNLKLMESVATEANDAVLITKAEPFEAPEGPEIIYVNRSFEKMTGYKADEVIGKTPRILQGPNTESEQLQIMRNAIRNQKAVEVELINYSKNGDEYWVNISISPVFEDDKCTHFISIQKDITDRRLRELQETLSYEMSRIFNREESVRQALQSSADEIIKLKHFDAVEFWRVDRDRTRMNLAAYTIGNPDVAVFYSEEEKTEVFKKGVGLPGKTWKKRENLFWRNLEKRKTFIRNKAAAKAGLKTAFSFPVMDEDDLFGLIVLLLSEDLKKERYYVDLFKELADQLASEIRRKELEEELFRIFNSAPDVICIAGLDGYYKKVNSAMSEMLGYTEKELLRRPIIDFVHPNDKQKTEEEFEALNRGEGNHYFENRHVTKSGKVIWLSWTTKPFYDEGITYSVAKDVTDEKELRELLDQANRLAKIGSWELDLMNSEVYWSDITREIHEEEPDFEPDLESGINYFKEGEPRKRILYAVEETVKDGTPWDLELPIITARGNEKWIRTIGEAELIDGKPVRIYGSFQDIHQRKVAELELQERTRHINVIASLNAALLNYTDWFEALDQHLEIIGEAVQADRGYYFENRFDQETGEGFTTQKLEWSLKGIEPQLNNPDLEEVPFREIPEVVEPMLKGKPNMILLSKIEKGTLTRTIMEDQEIKSFLTIPVNVQGVFYGFVGFDKCTEESKWSEGKVRTLRTITSNLAVAIERSKEEKERQLLLDEKNTILESIGDAFFAVDLEWTVTYWNNKAEEILGMPREKILGENLWDLYEDAKSLEFYTQYHQAVEKQIDVHFEEYYPTLEIWFEVSAYPSSLGLSVFFKDITERKKANERMKELNRALEQQTKELAASNAELEQFAFVASHDLQEPLRMITSFLAQLERKYGDELDDKAQKYIHFATDGAKRMRQIILDLLDYSRVGKVDIEREEVDLNEILDVVKRLHNKLIEEKKAVVTWDKMPVISAAGGPMQQLFQNLVHNALSYQKKGNKPAVKIWSEESEDHWKFYVRDNGIGIDPEYTDQIFNIFQRLHGRDEYSGTGVGLAICKKIVEDHGGEIGVESEPGEGSTFYFTIKK